MENLKKLTEEYLNECNIVLEYKRTEAAGDLVSDIVSAFETEIPNIGKDLDFNWPDFNGGGYTHVADNLSNLKKVKNKLEIYLAKLNDGVLINKSVKKETSNGVNITFSNNNTNNNTNNNINNNSMDLIFKKVKEEIENNESISEEEIKEVLEKISEIEAISKLDEAKNKKWFKLRPTMEWLGTKGVNVATAILGLITAILKMK